MEASRFAVFGTQDRHNRTSDGNNLALRYG